MPAVYDTVVERVKVADSYKVWKRGRAWIGKAVDVRPLRGFVVGKDGRVDGATVDTQGVTADNTRLDDDVMCLVEVPEQYDTITRQVLRTPASVREEVIPAQYATVKRQVMDQEAGTTEQEIPAAYQTITRQEIDLDKLKAQGYKFDAAGDIVAAPNGDRVLRAAVVAGAAGAAKTAGAGSGAEGYVREIKIPAEYKTISRQVVDQPATVRTVEVPATHKTVKSRVVATPASTEETVIPAEYQTVTRQVVDVAPSTREIVIPAVYKTVERRVVDVPASVRKVPVPAVYETVKRRVVDVPAQLPRAGDPGGDQDHQPPGGGPGRLNPRGAGAGAVRDPELPGQGGRGQDRAPCGAVRDERHAEQDHGDPARAQGRRLRSGAGQRRAAGPDHVGGQPLPAGQQPAGRRLPEP